MNPLKKLEKKGQALWLDYIRRNLITSGELKRLIDEDGLKGVTSNPTIFEKALSGSTDYDQALAEALEKDAHGTERELYEMLVVEDIQMAADVLRPVYDKTGGEDGYVSLELSPALAYDTNESIKEALYFWKKVDRPNVMLKVPATKAGIPVIEELISRGINVNITLMFSMSHYDAVAEAYLKGLERLEDPSKVASVASFFVSRVDGVVDRLLTEIGSKEAIDLKGKIAIANSKVVYERFKEVFRSKRWQELEKKGAKAQRVLWASTSTKDPEYRDVLYVEELIGAHTVNTIPPATMAAFRDHGMVRSTLDKDLPKARDQLQRLGELKIDLEVIGEDLQRVGAEKFQRSYDDLINALKKKIEEFRTGRISTQEMMLGVVESKVEERLGSWRKMEFGRRLAEKDPTLWSEKPIPEVSNRIGWFDLPERMHDGLDELQAFAEEIRDEGFQTVVLLGMGGSSLAPEVYQRTFGNKPGYPELIILDSTHPDRIYYLRNYLSIDKTLFIVASKSGTTLEPNSFYKYFWKELEKDGVKHPGRHFIAITDPGTTLSKLAREKKFRKVFYAYPDLGGRYSALTSFGMVPAALIGMDVHTFLDRAWTAKEACSFCIEESEVLGLRLGAALGELALKGRDKVTFITSNGLSAFPNWLEQLIAESTGKKGRGLIPVAGEPLLKPEEYGKDRVFCYIRLIEEEDPHLNSLIKALEERGHPIITTLLKDPYDLAQEIFKWEVAIASAGSILGINPFDQPDVERAKILAKELMKKGSAAKEDIDELGWEDPGLPEHVKAWLDDQKEGDYIVIQAYLNPTEETVKSLREILTLLAGWHGIPISLSFGPRFLHSTGQLHKGGPNTGLFLQLVDEPQKDISVPGEDYTFGDIIKAQALGDYKALKERERRILRINLGDDPKTGINKLKSFFRR